MPSQAKAAKRRFESKKQFGLDPLVGAKFSRYWHTVRHLRPIQIAHQLKHHCFAPKPRRNISDIAHHMAPILLRPWPRRPQSYLGDRRFCFLNHECGADWQAPGQSHLWQYNLHYFDYLHQADMDRQTGLALMRSWIENHPPVKGNVGWEPYPISLRLVNWIKFCRPFSTVPADIGKSIALQAENLKRGIEYRLMGNHLFANAKALWFAGRFLNDIGLEKLGKTILLRELDEQFLPDGGHFERSPMYHAILTEDLLDLINLCQAANTSPRARKQLEKTARLALGWLDIITDANGDIPLLNDAVHGVATPYRRLKQYAHDLGIRPDSSEIAKHIKGNWRKRDLSGYQVLSDGPLRLIFDTAPLGPQYLPGHAHCDMLAILMDFQGEPIFTDTGVYQYAETACRAYSRGTQAHNTVVLDDLQQAEIWKGFRMGRRGHPMGFWERANRIGCSHTGFCIRKKGLYHERTLDLSDHGFAIKDRVRGPHRHRFQSFFHCAPGVCVRADGHGGLIINERLRIQTRGAEVHLTQSEYYPEFGITEKRPCIVMSGEFYQQTEFGIQCTYSF